MFHNHKIEIEKKILNYGRKLAIFILQYLHKLSIEHITCLVNESMKRI